MSTEPGELHAGQSKRWRWPSLPEVLSVIAIIVSVGVFLIGLHVQEHQNMATTLQNDRSLLLQLRNQYSRISSLEEHPNGRELEASLGIAAGLLHSLSRVATGEDYFFIADSYRSDHFPQLAVPLYKEAIIRLNAQPANQIAALRGLGYADVLLEEPKAAHAALAQAVEVNARSSYPQIIKYDNEANTQRVWVTVAATAHECSEVKRHAEQYFALLRDLPEPNWGPARGDVKVVVAAMKACR
jgi:hypothetical protein